MENPNLFSKDIKILKVLNLITTVFMGIIIIAFLNIYEQDLYSIGVISIVLYIIFFVSWFIQCKDIINFYSIFLLFTYLFYFGQFFLLLVGGNLDYGTTITSGILPYKILIKTGSFIISYMIVLHIGVLLSTFNISSYNNNRSNTKSDLNKSILNNNFKKIGFLLFFISIIPSFIILIENIKIMATHGYGAIFQSVRYTSGGFNNILRFLSLFTIPSFLILLITCKGDKKLKFINLVIFVYLLLYFFSGSRLSGVLLLSTLLLIKNHWYIKISTKSIIKIIILTIVGMTALSLISAVRNSIYVSNDVQSLLKETYKQIIDNNPIFSAMKEAGFTFLATATVIAYCPSIIPYNNGMSYLNSLFMLIPNLFWDVHPAAKTNTDIVFKGFITEYGGIGSSFIAESYWNFGGLSIFIALIFGILIGSLTKKILKYSKEGNSIKFYLYIYIAQFSLFYVRSDTVSFWRNLIYFGITPIIMVILLSKPKIIKDEKLSEL
ncbi:O-antigen polysaccharide polymerase Wzy family protein [Clostridium algidicarnis]|uniref:O-antigen polysaccharide polymerase Wzy n=1 Tax=Clostridium algidicarnis TaxID=37659 RepID=UPI001C0C767B|nr:O-antigen polysaccharide polymerase Wzy [Clostridium algidicarnis]MBU3197378.1 O-antigen polysaccharide polymerase Wzy family protein [Clostridium algidicarnis]